MPPMSPRNDDRAARSTGGPLAAPDETLTMRAHQTES